MTKQIGIAGAGFAGAVLARELAITGKYSIEVFDERPHVAGNCHTSRDPSSGIMLHHYGPHIFNTSRQDVWEYVNQYATFGAYTNRVKAITARGVFSMPMNLLTINQFFGKVMNPAQAQEFLAKVGDSSIKEPHNFEEQALRFLGRELYENFFYGYTKKQWGVEPRELPASILQRLPVRFNYDDNYYQQRYQGIPIEGYTAIVEKILDHPAIKVHVGQRLEAADRSQFDHLFWSGPLDSYFEHELGRLQYRSLVFERFDATGDYQGNAVINYCQESVPWTRIAEHKHFTPWELHEKTVCYREYSKLSEDKDIPYYPLRLERDKSMLREYMHFAEKTSHVTFIGRLGTYRYLDMHVVIGESLDLARSCLAADIADWPKFSGKPLN
ncbi:MAG: UDP-galactopyranose mutase [Betaproteobacteria bacterium]|nr:UDP-galactopyranose mutase [Betaproteobacteria bacterium]